MNVAKPAAVSAIAVAGMLAASAWAWPQAPAQIATHWGLSGGPDRWSSKTVALLMEPAVAVALSLLFAGLPAVMPKTARLERSPQAYATAWIAVVLVLALAHGVSVLSATGAPVQPVRIVGAGVGVAIAVLGDLMGKMRRNFVMGVRTPWTLADERVWDRTHRTLGPWVMAWGGAILLTAVFGDGRAAQVVALAGALLLVLGATSYSYLVARRLGSA